MKRPTQVALINRAGFSRAEISAFLKAKIGIPTEFLRKFYLWKISNGIEAIAIGYDIPPPKLHTKIKEHPFIQ